MVNSPKTLTKYTYTISKEKEKYGNTKPNKTAIK